MTVHQGIFLSTVLSDEWLMLKILRIIPISWVRVSDIEYLRISSFREHVSSLRHGINSQYWPSYIRGYRRKTAPVYMLQVKGDERRIFIRVKSGFHYRLRTAINREKENENINPAPW